jgi:2-oxoglutarate dehydrogenase E2 component (dihydrolipoamide succinyltransferase)
MPQMGESIAEGTIVRWIKKVGDTVERDEPLFEISTDKVDAEIPAPAAGVVTEIRAKEGETVPVNSVVAVIGQAEARPAAEPRTPARAAAPPTPSPQADGAPTAQATAEPARAHAPEAAPQAVARAAGPAADESAEEALRQRSSPLVRRIAKEHNVDISKIPGSGIAGRVTKDDILVFIASQERDRTAPPPAAARPAKLSTGAGMAGQAAPMSVMRKQIAEHMVQSLRTSAHVYSVFEVNFGRVAQVRESRKADYEAAGARLTYLSFIVKAAADALRAVPVVNASVEGDHIVYHKQVNVGIAVALDWGLIVPVVKDADEKNLLGLSRAIADLAARARSKHLKPEEVAGGTFTITNPGSLGTLFGMPIINQPQVAILGVGAIEKRAVVLDDAIAIRPMGYLSLGYDHRIVDGAVADEFMGHVKRALESWDPAQA